MKKKLIAFICLLLLIAAGIAIVFVVPKKTITLELEGETSIEIELKEEFTEPGYKASLCKNKKCEDITDKVEVENNIVEGTVGKYEIKYTLNYKDKQLVKTREILVIDNVPPIIELIGEKEIIMCPNASYEEEGFKASDNYDGEITDSVKVETSDEGIDYLITDSSGNESKITRKIIKKDDVKPTITLKGNNPYTMYVNKEYEEKGYTAKDNCSGDLTKEVKVESNVDNTKVGTYQIKYTVADQSGNETTIIRTVNVKEQKEVKAATTINAKTKDEITSYIKNKGVNISVGYVNLVNGDSYYYKPDTVYFGASLIKTIDALYIYEKTNFNEETRKLVEKAVSVSNNEAHKKLVDQIGTEVLKEYGKALGAAHTLTSKVNKYFSDTTIKEQIAVWKYLYKFINSNPKGTELKNYFINTYGNKLVFNGLPTTMHKYGYQDNYYHDVGIVFADEPYIIAILTKEGNKSTIINDLSKIFYDYNRAK